MTNQELFDKVSAHLLSQKIASVDPLDRQCLYRGPGGLKCAIGALIPDAKYREEMEQYGVTTDLVAQAAGVDTEDKDQLLLASRLQRLHDTVHPGRWASELETIRRAWGFEKR